MSARRGLFIGVNKYGKDSGLADLQWAEEDARRLAEEFDRKFDFTVTTLLGDEADRAAIERELNLRKKDQPGDIFAFFFAGHGAMDGKAFTLYPSGSSIEGDGTLAFSTFTNKWHNQFPYGKILAMIDACRRELQLTGARGSGEQAFSNAIERDIDQQIKCGSALIDIVHGCDQGNVSWEFEELQHGLFTHGLLESIKTLTGKITADTLAGNASDIMKAWCEKNGKQSQQPFRRVRATFINQIVLRDGPDDYVICPQCHQNNASKSVTFRCPACRRDNLCLTHRDNARYICTSCVAQGKVSCPACGHWNQGRTDTFTCPECERQNLCTSHRVKGLQICADCALNYVECPVCGRRNHSHKDALFDCPKCGKTNICTEHRDSDTGLCLACSAKKAVPWKLLAPAAMLLLGGVLVIGLQQRPSPPAIETSPAAPAPASPASLADYAAGLHKRRCPADISTWLADLRGKIAAGQISAQPGDMDGLLAGYQKGCNAAALRVEGVPLGAGTAAPFWYLPEGKEGGFFFHAATGEMLGSGKAFLASLVGRFQARDTAICSAQPEGLFPLLQRMEQAGTLEKQSQTWSNTTGWYNHICGNRVARYEQLDPAFTGTVQPLFFYTRLGDDGLFADAATGAAVTTGKSFVAGLAGAIENGAICSSSKQALYDSLAFMVHSDLLDSEGAEAARLPEMAQLWHEEKCSKK
ncbi:MAG: caspase family protein [bacterium]|nr:caspase family protein [bacterium]